MWGSEKCLGKLLALGINDNSFKRLKGLRFEIFYRFGKISLNASREAREAPVGTVVEEAKEFVSNL